MIWPFSHSIVRQREELLQLRIQELEQQLAHECQQTAYFRSRYEKIADELLFAKGAIAAPVHVESMAHVKERLADKVMRVANLAGSGRGVDFNANKTRGFELPKLG